MLRDPNFRVRVISPTMLIWDPFAADNATSDNRYLILFLEACGIVATSIQLRLAPQSTKKSTVTVLSTSKSTCGLLSLDSENLMAAILDVIWMRSLPSSISVPSCNGSMLS